MANYALCIAFDGRSYSGTALQPGQQTLQGLFIQALRAINESAAQLQPCSRLDAGVSALELGANIHCQRAWEPRALGHALNAQLPESI